MWHDPIIEEIHQTREKIAAAYGNDLHAIFMAARLGELATALDQTNLDFDESVANSRTKSPASTPNAAVIRDIERSSHA